MKLRMIILVFTLLSASFGLQAQHSMEEKEALQAFRKATEDFARLDAKAFSENFTTDATLINPIGNIIRTKQAIYEGHAYYFSTDAAKAESGGTSEFVDIQWQKLADGLLYCSLTAHWLMDGTKVGADAFSLILRKTDAGWKIQHGQITPVAQQMPNN
ncbi:MAG: nuclear transport factor 2 family protein [Phaeodactylibacter sp.]|nr:nuclear transport factor 2 family protein [Phaeodactylibacter sp.]